MVTVGSYEAKTHLPRILEDVATGEVYVITKNGKPVAQLIPVESRPDPADVIAELRAAREGVTLGDITVRELVEEGRR